MFTITQYIVYVYIYDLILEWSDTGLHTLSKEMIKSSPLDERAEDQLQKLVDIISMGYKPPESRIVELSELQDLGVHNLIAENEPEELARKVLEQLADKSLETVSASLYCY